MVSGAGQGSQGHRAVRTEDLGELSSRGQSADGQPRLQEWPEAQLPQKSKIVDVIDFNKYPL